MEEENQQLIVRRGTLPDYKAIQSWDEFWGDRRMDAAAGNLFIADLCGRVVGYAVCGAPVFNHLVFVSQLCVEPTHRNTGVASSLLSYILHLYAPSDIWTSTEDFNAAAMAAFCKAGFERKGSISGMNEDGSDEVYFCFKRLLG